MLSAENLFEGINFAFARAMELNQRREKEQKKKTAWNVIIN